MNEWESLRNRSEMLKKEYPKGTRIVLIEMSNDPLPVAPGTRGTVAFIDDLATVHCDFDDGRRLGMLWGVDSFRKLTTQELAEEQQMTGGSTEPKMKM